VHLVGYLHSHICMRLRNNSVQHSVAEEELGIQNKMTKG